MGLNRSLLVELGISGLRYATYRKVLNTYQQGDRRVRLLCAVLEDVKAGE